MSSVTVKVENEADPSNTSGDSKVFSSLQSAVEACQERIKRIRKRLRPVKKRLVKKMEDEGLTKLTCGEFILTNPPDSEEEEATVAFTRERLEQFLTEEQMEEYCEDNKRPSKKRRVVKCERVVVDISETEE